MRVKGVGGGREGSGRVGVVDVKGIRGGKVGDGGCQGVWSGRVGVVQTRGRGL